MRLFITELGEEAWFAALLRNVRLDITRFEIGALDVYTLSGAKQAGRTVQQFRDDSYDPAWQPDYTALYTNDVVGYEGTIADIGYWRVSSKMGGIILRVPANAASMTVGNVRVYAKNTGPMPYGKLGPHAYKQYQEVFTPKNGGEILLFTGFASVADTHWQAETEFPHFIDIRLAIHADGLFNNLDRRIFAFEGDVDVLSTPTERTLARGGNTGENVAVIASHSVTNRPAVAYRTHGIEEWFGYPLHEAFVGDLEYPPEIENSVLENGTLDYGTISPDPLLDVAIGVVIASQPRRLTLNPLAFQVREVDTWSFATAVSTINIQPNPLQPYTCRIQVADLAFLGGRQTLYFVHNGTRYPLCINGKARNTPLLVLKHGDSVSLEGTLVGPISSLTGIVYATLNEEPVSSDANNSPVWLYGEISMHLTGNSAVIPHKLDYGLTGRRIAGYNWMETTPEQRVTGLGYDMYGIPQALTITIRAKPSANGAAGIGYTRNGQIATGDTEPSFLATDYLNRQGSQVIRRGVTGLPGTALHVIHNGVDLGPISTPEVPEGSVQTVVKENDRISFRAILNGQAYDVQHALDEVLPNLTVEVEAITNERIPFLKGTFDISATFGPDAVPPTVGALPGLPPIAPLPNTVGSASFGDMASHYLLNRTVNDSPTYLQPIVINGEWVTVMAAPNPTLGTDMKIVGVDLVYTGPLVDHGYTVEVELFSRDGPQTKYLLANASGVKPQLTIAMAPCATFRIVASMYDPDTAITLGINIDTEFGVQQLLVQAAVRSS